jgi:hypothetical protein
MNESIKAYSDEITERLDDLSFLAEYWDKSRKKGREPRAIRRAMIIICEEVSEMLNKEKKIISDTLGVSVDEAGKILDRTVKVNVARDT